MSVTRRGLLRMMPGLPAAARAAKQAAEQALTGVAVSRVPHPYDDAIEPSIYGRARRGKRLLQLFKSLGLPDWKKREIRRDARRNRILDPDIAALHSISVSAKINMQWRRNEARAEKSLFTRLLDDDEREDFFERHGTDI